MKKMLAALALAGSALIALPALEVSAQAVRPAPAKQAAAQAWIVNKANSALVFSGEHAGRKFQGTFRDWTADVRFDPANLAGSSVRVAVNVASASTGDRQYDTTLPETEWFNTRAFPQAIFQSRVVRRTSTGSYAADGTLTMKGVAYPVTLAFDVTITGANAQARGSALLDRVAMDLGRKSDGNAEWVSRQIRVGFQLSARKA